jgi:hypothetical protein
MTTLNQSNAEVTDPINGGFVATGVEAPIALIFEWDAT